MKTTPAKFLITKKILAACAVLFAVFSVNAQVATLYTFSQFQGTYTPITTGGTVFNTSTYDDEQIVDGAGTTMPPNFSALMTGAGVSIGFNFVYNNQVFDKFGISNNGYITLGNSADGANAIYDIIVDWNKPMSSAQPNLPKNQHRIIALGTDLYGKTGSAVRVVTLGTAPTRSCIIQWSDYQTYVFTPTGADNINFQLCLYETSNIIDVVYGTFNSPTLDTCAQVGLKGGSTADFNNRSVTGNLTWATSVAGTANNYFARYNSTLFPASGQTYRWSLPQCSGALAAISTTAATSNICPGDLFNLSFSTYYPFSGVSYTWQSSATGAGGPYTTMPYPTVSSSLTGVTTNTPTWYQVSGTCIHSNSTVTAAAFQVSVNLAPTIGAVATPTSLCSGSSLTLTAIGNSNSHSWIGGYTSGVGFPATTSQNYTVIGTSVNGCTASAFVAVTVSITPVNAPIVTPSIVCIGSTGTLTAPGAASYTWASATNTVYTSSFVITPANTGSETYTVTKANGACVDTKMITVVTNSLPGIFALATPPTICSLSQSTLAAAGGNTYTWTAPGFGPVINPSPIVSPSVTTVYSVAVSDGTCISTTTVMVTTNPIPTISISGSTNTICRGGAVTMTATGGLTHTWTSSPGTINLVATNISQTPTVTTAYNVVGNNAVGCTSTAQFFVQVNSLPNVGGTVTKTLVCSGGLSTLSATGANSYTWDPISIYTPSTVVSTTANVSGPVIYTVTGLNATTGCQNTKTLSVTVFVPVLTVSGNTNTCAGGDVSLQGFGGNVGTYTWTTGTGSPVNNQILTTNVSAASVFTLSAKTTSGSVVCPGTKTVQIDIFFNPSITAVAQKTTVCRYEFFELYGEGGTTYDWSNGMQGSTVTVGPVNNVSTLNYTVTGTDANGCTNTATVQVKVSGCSGVNELGGLNNGVNIYPNPNNGVFTIQADKDIILTLSNELGQVIRTIGLSGINSREISVTDLAKGIYFISGQGVNQKIVVAK